MHDNSMLPTVQTFCAIPNVGVYMSVSFFVPLNLCANRQVVVDDGEEVGVGDP